MSFGCIQCIKRTGYSTWDRDNHGLGGAVLYRARERVGGSKTYSGEAVQAEQSPRGKWNDPDGGHHSNLSLVTGSHVVGAGDRWRSSGAIPLITTPLCYLNVQYFLGRPLVDTCPRVLRLRTNPPSGQRTADPFQLLFVSSGAANYCMPACNM
jgi:hypothetical protein